MGSPTDLVPPATFPKRWVLARVGDVGDIRLGRQRSPDRATGDFPTHYLRAGNITATGLDLSDVAKMDFQPDEREVYALEVGDLVLAEASGSANLVGRAAVWEGELPLCCFQNTVIRFRAGSALSEFAHAVFQFYSAAGYFGQVARGIGILHLGAKRLADVPFPLPSRAEQGRIVESLSEKLREIELAQEALDSAAARSVDYEHELFRAVMTGRLAPGGDLPDASEDHADLQGRLRGRPHWRWPRVRDVGTISSGKAVDGGREADAPPRPYLRVANVQDGHIDTTTIKSMPISEKEEARYRLRRDDVLLCDGQSIELVGRPALVTDVEAGMAFQNHLLRFRAGNDVLPEFALLVFRAYLHLGEFRRVARGSTNIATLSQSRFGDMPFPVPPIEEQKEIVATASSLLEESRLKLQFLHAAINNIDQLRVETMRAAFEGRMSTRLPNDGDPAAELRLYSAERDRRPAQRKRPMTSRRRRSPAYLVPGRNEIEMVLREASAPVSFVDLCRKLGTDINDVDAIERVYQELRAAVGSGLEIQGSGENAVVTLRRS